MPMIAALTLSKDSESTIMPAKSNSNSPDAMLKSKNTFILKFSNAEEEGCAKSWDIPHEKNCL